MMDNSYRNAQSPNDQYPYHSYYNSQQSSPAPGQSQPVNQQMYTSYRDNALDNGSSSSWNQNDSMSWNSTHTSPEPQLHQRGRSIIPPRPKLSTHLWEDEGTICYQVDARSICVARRQDNDMINGTKLLNVVGMSRGKRDGILKNEKGRVVVKVGSMHLKGVWITFARAKALAGQYKIIDMLYPLFVDNPSLFLYMSPLATGTSASQFPHFAGHYRNHPCLNTFNNSSWERQQQHEGSQSENCSTVSSLTGKPLKLGLQDSSSSRLSMHSHNDIDLLGTGMEYRNASSANENTYNNGPTSSAPGMAVGGLVRSSHDQYADHYSQMPSGAPPDHGYDSSSFTSSQHVTYPQAGLPPLLNTRSKTQDYHQDNGELNETGDSLLGKTSTLRNTPSSYMPPPPTSPNSLKNESHSTNSAPSYDQNLPPMAGSQQQPEFYLFGGVHSNMPNSKDGQGYESRSSGFVDVRRPDLS
ncbi:hypothetical protein INT43_008257 [Umbelopsis isabellina]|uniref:HTH APSES-type domain-containing protein n=1 Tax=Mortierella isabellina TaxID=91625 RepID=A0A8H7U6P7_MORIS|nr:hypothetical protein INT43_008257 [Umbelopsis isabellina]